MITNRMEGEVYINTEDLSDSGVLNLPNDNDITKAIVWYEDDEYLVNTVAIYKKRYNEDLEQVELFEIHDSPICIYKILEKKNANEEQGITNSIQYVMMKYRISGLELDAQGRKLARYKTSVMLTNDALQMKSTGRFDPPHLLNGWTAPTDSKTRAAVLKILNNMKRNCITTTAYERTGWHYDERTGRYIHITPSHPYYLGARNFAYVSKSGTRERWAKVMTDMCLNSPMYALIFAAAVSSFLRGIIPIETVSHALILCGKAGMGKTTILNSVGTITGPFSNTNNDSSAPTAIEGGSSMAATEDLLQARNNATLGFNEFDSYVKKNGVEATQGLMNGGNRIVKNNTNTGINIKKWCSLLLATANNKPSQIAESSGGKFEAFLSRILELDIEDPIIHRFEDGKNGFSLAEAEMTLANNYGHGYEMITGFISDNIEMLSKTLQKKFDDYKANQELKKHLAENETRLLLLFSYIETGGVIIESILGAQGKLVNQQVISAVSEYVKKIKTSETNRNHEAKSIEIIKQLKNNIMMNPRAFIWEGFAYDNESMGESLQVRSDRQKELAGFYSKENTPKIGIIKQVRPFEDPFDFEGEVLFNINARDINVINFSRDSQMQINEIIDAAKKLGLVYEQKNGKYTKQVLTKTTTKQERAYFANLPKNVTRILLRPFEEDIEEAEVIDSSIEAVLKAETEEMSKHFKRKVTTHSKNSDVLDTFDDMIRKVEKKKEREQMSSELEELAQNNPDDFVFTE